MSLRRSAISAGDKPPGIGAGMEKKGANEMGLNGFTSKMYWF